MTPPAASQSRLDVFIARLRAALSGMPEREIDDILKELRSHVTDLMELHGSDVEAALRSLGDPVDLARRYRAESHMARAECSGSPLVILQGLRHASRSDLGRLTVTLLYILGYTSVVTLLGAGIEKIVSPSRTGLWWIPDHAWSLSLVMSGDGPPGAREILGWWLVPSALAAGWVMKFLTDHAALWWIRKYRRSMETEPT
jgi:hypothetical protein